jgi:DNA-binding beta-propeller fold protein YncE
VGPSAVAIGDGVAYVGNRATSEVCAVDATRLTLGKCVKLPSPSDGVAYVASAKEVWVTTPRSQTIAVLDASHPDTLKPKTSIKLDGEPEGYASDNARGLFFTNLEDKNKTVVIDVKTHKPKASWPLDCGTDGPRGVAVDGEHSFVFVACTDHLLVLDGSHEGAKLATLDTGAGVDNIEWLAPQRLLYVAAGKAAKLTVARIDDKGQPTVVATGASVEGARNGVVDGSGNAYVADSNGARLLVFPFVQ